MRPNAPSYNGRRERLSLLIAPYGGDEPPLSLRADAEAFFHTPAVVIATSSGVRLPRDLRKAVSERRSRLARQQSGPLTAPEAFLANPTTGAVDLVWDPPRDARVLGFDIAWRPRGHTEWAGLQIPLVDRHRIVDRTDGEVLEVRVRARGDDLTSPWSETIEVRIGPVAGVDVRTEIENAPIGLLLKTFWYGLVHLLTTL